MSDMKPHEISRSHRRELVQYHITLKQFLSMSVAAKANPSRAVKAREKLLKLSPSQFFELGTDVYDELTRRIDESTNEPDFLLPKSSFHPRRNEAREKLGSLQATRFRDLASDILYEIERRKYHILPESKTPSPEKDLRNSMSPQSKHKPSKSIGSIDLADHNKEGVVTIQSATVIPTKADMDWGSDDEDLDPQNGKLLKSPLNAEKRQSYESHRTSNTSVVSASKNLNKSPQHQSRTSYGSNDIQHGFSPNGRGLSIGNGRNKDREIELLLDEGTKMDKVITELEQRNTLLQTKSDKFEQESIELKRLNETLNFKIQAMEREIHEKSESLSSSIRAQKRNEDALIEVKKEKSASEEASIDSLKREVVEWKSRFEELKFKKIEDLLTLDKISESSIKSLVSSNGVIPTNLVSALRSIVQKFLLDLNQSKRSQGVDVDELFSNVSDIVKISSKIAALSPLNAKAELIRAAISHAITTARYFAVYPELLPKLVIESAVSEITFSVFEFISELKLRSDDSDLPSSPINSTETTTFKGNAEDVSPVRPLRMGKKSFDSLTNGAPESVTPDGPRILSLTINSKLANDSDNIGKKPFNLGSRDSPISKTPQTSTPMKTGFPSVVSRFSPDVSERDATPVNGLRKSSSSNILSKVKQFEQQSEPVANSYNPKKASVSPLQSSIVDKFGGRKASGGVEIVQDFKPRNLSKDLSQDNSSASNSSTPIKNTRESPKPAQQRSSISSSSPISNRFSNDSLLKSPEGVSKTQTTSSDVLGSPRTVRAGSLETHSDSKKDFSSSPRSENDDSFNAFDLGNEISQNNNISKQYSPSDLKRQTSLNKAWNVSPTVGSSTTASSRTTAAVSTTSGITADNDSEEVIPESKAKNSLAAAFSDGPQQHHQDPTLDQVSADDSPKSMNRVTPLKVNNNVVNHTFPGNADSYDQDTIKSPKRTVSGGEQINQDALDAGHETTPNGSTSFRGNSSTVRGGEYEIADEIKPQTLEIKSNGHSTAEEDHNDEESDQEGTSYSKDRTEEEYDVRDFDIEDPDNTLSELLLYLEHQTVQVIETIQALLSSIKAPDSTNGELRSSVRAIDAVVSQMVEATNISMNQSRNAQLKDHGAWVVTILTDAGTRMLSLCAKDNDGSFDEDDHNDDNDYADKNFKQRLAGIAFDVAKSTKELVKIVEEANLKEEIEHLNARLVR
ncbi:hypothetical protein WICPIJ_006703 [Wickerhamomyces pijperi]|uniref:GIT Spa2 homology (SHD) domain-containing protein n=1 Tax=Wickerhamomyces pijperi TaxID=599730 RepID=A0A9P8Q1J5_WICPI|nr:hypothetical protein WICPIJ_006703 [Wickerhamomyces pijperi]